MAETSVKNQVCNSCGSEARPHALFCFHCGKSLQAEEFSGAEKNNEPSDVWFREEITGEKGESGDEPFEHEETEADDEEFSDDLIDEKIAMPDEDLDEHLAPEPSTEPELKKENVTRVQIKPKPSEPEAKAGFNNSKLRSASSLRRKGKPARLKMVEIIWEEKEGSPNVWFIIFALFFCLLVGALIFISLYIK
jgi:hypothetical protein